MAKGRIRKGLSIALGAGAALAVAGGAVIAAADIIRRLDLRFGPRVRAGRIMALTAPDAGGEPVRLLAIGGAIQSGSYLAERRFELPFEYFRAFDRIFGALPGARDVLVIGGGGYAWPKSALMAHDSLSVDVCEPEAKVTEAARRWLFLDELEERAGDRLRILETDGLSWLREADRRYDAVIDDAFSGFRPADELVGDEGIALVRERLAPGGLFVVNVVCGQDISRLREIVTRLERSFAHVHTILATDATFSDDDNYVVFATDGEYAFEGEL